MDTQARLTAARAIVLERRDALLRIKQEAGQPCTRCRFYVAPRPGASYQRSPPAHCGHPAYEKLGYNAATGKLAVEHPTTTDEARIGLCGTDGALFERSPLLPVIGASAFIIGWIAFAIFV